MSSRLIRTTQMTPVIGIAIVFACILVFAVTRQYTQLGFDPLAANDIDEIWIYQESYDAFVQGLPPEERTIPTQPPVILWIDNLTYQFLVTQGADATTSQGNAVLNIVRQLTILPNLVTALLIFVIGYTLGYPWLGLLAMLIWGISPTLMSERNVALAEPWLMPFIAASFWALVVAARRQSRGFAILSTVFALLAIITKYNMFPFLGLSVGLVFALCWRDWRRWLPVFFIQVLLIAMTALFLFSVIPLQGMFTTTRETEVTQFITGGSAYISLNFFWQLVQLILGHISLNSTTWYGVMLLGIILLGVGRILWLATNHERVVLGIVGLVLFSNTVIILFYTWKWDIVDRYASVMSISSALIAVFGLYYGILFLYDSAHGIMKKRGDGQTSSRASRLQSTSLFIVSLVIWFVPVASQINQSFALPNAPRVEQPLIEWGRLALNDGTVILPEDSNWLWVYFDAEWGGYSPPLPTWVKESLDGRTLQEWAEVHVNYALFREHNHETLLARDDYETYASSMTLMRHFETETPDQPWRGSAVYVYWLDTIESPMRINFGEDIVFTGVTLNQTEQATTLRTYWQARQSIARDYQMFAQWVKRDTNSIVAQLDTSPTSARYPMSQWQPQDAVIVGTEITLNLPQDAEVGTYDLIMGLYDLSTFTRLPVAGATTDTMADTTPNDANASATPILGADYIVLETRTIE